MFNLKFSYHIGSPLKTSTISNYGENYSEYYKIKVSDKKIPYIIRLDYFDNDVVFIKFYHSRFDSNKDKYKMRYNKNLPLTRNISTCIKLAERKHQQNKELKFFFFGEWDETDVEKQKITSQRFELYSKVVSSKINYTKFQHIEIKSLNIYGFIPREIYSSALELKLTNQFDKIFGENLLKLQVPKKED